MNEMFKDEIPVKNQPVLRHILAHIYMAIDSLSENCPLDAQDHIAGIAPLIGMDEDIDWEDYYKKELVKWQSIKNRKEP